MQKIYLSIVMKILHNFVLGFTLGFLRRAAMHLCLD
jgi:hypothetical protein